MYLADNIQQKLRTAGKIDINEILLKEGDLYVAVNVTTQQRRIVNADRTLLEAIGAHKKLSERQILKG